MKISDIKYNINNIMFRSSNYNDINYLPIQ